jgi:SPX domain protein involved in polyphosphate accumulation
MNLFKKPEQTVIPWRFEYKYRISLSTYYQFRNALAPHMEQDHYTRRSPSNRYLVRSLYFDNDQYQAYYEKIEGNFGRIKCRIRTYSETMEENTVIKAELKNRWGESIEKYSTLISPDDYKFFMKNRHWPDQDNSILQEFERIYYLRAMKPKVLVEYYREGYIPRNREDVRITLDHDVRSCSTDSLFPKPAHFKRHYFHLVILEIKCRKQQPYWLSRLIRQYGLKYIANSKYTQGIDAVSPDFISPY